MSERLEDWPRRLDAALALACGPGGEFKWGRTDCAMRVGDAIKAMTGEDPFKDWRGKYSTRAGGVKLAKKRGFAGFIDALAGELEAFGCEEIKPAFAARGDVVLFSENGVETVGVVDLSGRLVHVPNEQGGEVRLPLALAIDVETSRAWRVA